MKTATLRDAMVARVKEAVEKWPTFADMPEGAEHDIRVDFKGDLSDIVQYISALHSICAVATPTGRSEKGMVGLADPDAADAKQRLGGGAEMTIV